MTFIYGIRRFGKVDEVPGLFYVTTSFYHLWFFPLIPMQSYVIVAGTGGCRGLPIYLSMKSVLIAWLRGALYAMTFFTAFGAILGAREYFSSPKPKFSVEELLYLAVAAMMLFCGLCLTYACSGAGDARARWLAARLDIPEAVINDRLEPCQSY
jgi:hypothetical protein